MRVAVTKEPLFDEEKKKNREGGTHTGHVWTRVSGQSENWPDKHRALSNSPFQKIRSELT